MFNFDSSSRDFTSPHSIKILPPPFLLGPCVTGDVRAVNSQGLLCYLHGVGFACDPSAHCLQPFIGNGSKSSDSSPTTCSVICSWSFLSSQPQFLHARNKVVLPGPPRSHLACHSTLLRLCQKYCQEDPPAVSHLRETACTCLHAVDGAGHTHSPLML